ncbi:MAG: protein kinase domain-containing protein [Bryobacteraceae bacterium]
MFRALDTRLNRTVAIKFPKRRFTEGFKSEARAAAALNHPNIVQIYELGSADGDEYIVMEFVPGRTFAQLIGEKRLSIKEALVCSHGIASALAAAHAAGIVHRDIKPGNIIVDDDLTLVKIHDFGLAMLEDRSPKGHGTPPAFPDTAPDAIQGTPSYMSPEQAQGKPLDARSDIFSTGLVLYEIFTGVRAFTGDSTRSILRRLVGRVPAGICELRPEVPRAIARVITRCLEKDPSRRYSSGSELATALMECSRPRRSVPLTPRIAAGITVVLIATVGTVGWLHYQNRNARWTRDEALPKIQLLVTQGDFANAFELTRTALRYAPDDPQLKQHWANVSWPLTVTTVPSGATISVRPFGATKLAWQPVGRTPFSGTRVPLAYMAIRIEKDGMEPVEFATRTANLQGQKIKLHRTGTIPRGMVAVPKQAPPVGPVKIMALPDYFLDKFEVTNRQFREFINSGGYRKKEYWRYPFFRDGRRIPQQQALAEFRDRTGQYGPASWNFGAFPNGQTEYPVGGVSWFEAAAYCESLGKSLPTVYHWQKAAGFGVYSDIVLFSNFTHHGPMRVGANSGITPFGAYDMAGNVKEWVQNNSGTRRLILGGSFSEPGITFHELDAQEPSLRLPNFGFRCASYPTPVPMPALSPVAPPERDYSTEKPVDNTIFQSCNECTRTKEHRSMLERKTSMIRTNSGEEKR